MGSFKELKIFESNIFIAQKMHGLSAIEVNAVREEAKKEITEFFKNRYPVLYNDMKINWIDNYNHDGIKVPEGAGRLWHLGTSITQLDKADYIYFTPDALDSKGGKIEYEIAKSYDITIINEIMKMKDEEKDV